MSFNRLTVKKLKLEYEILADEGNALAEKFGIRFALPGELQKIYTSFGIDVPKSNGDDSWTLPMPARYLIGVDGIIRAADVDPDYTVRTEPEETLQAIKALPAG